VRLSVVEIYCERIRDLLDPSRDNLAVKQDASGAIFIDGAGVACAACAARKLASWVGQGLKLLKPDNLLRGVRRRARGAGWW
jgi:hypothetical protein